MRSPFDSRRFRELMLRTAESLDGSLECLKQSDELVNRATTHNRDLIRWICGQVDRETDPAKMEELLQLVRADLEDVRIRMEFRKKYAMVFSKRQLPMPGNDHE